MKLECFADGVDGEPLILLYEGLPEEVSQLRIALRALSEHVDRRIDIDELPFVQPIGQCRLRAASAEKDFGVIEGAPMNFEWILSTEAWLEVAELLEPFCAAHEGVAFQSLNPLKGPSILYSTTRSW